MRKILGSEVAAFWSVVMLVMSDGIKAASLTSATSCSSIFARGFSDVHSSKYFSTSRMNSHEVLHIGFCCLQFHHSSKRLGNFSSIGTQIMKSEDAFVIFDIHNQLNVAGIFRTVCYSPFQRPEVTMININGSITELFSCVFFGISNSAIF